MNDRQTDSHAPIGPAIQGRSGETESWLAAEPSYRRLVESTKDIIWTADLNLQITYMSPSVMEVLGFAPAEYVGRPIVEHLTADSIAVVQKLLAETFERSRVDSSLLHLPYTCEVEFVAKGGGTVWVEVRASFLLDDAGRPTGIIGITRDISDRKRAEDALHRSEQRYRLLTETTSDWVWETNAEGLYTYVSDKAKDLLGYETEYLLGKSPFDIMPPDEAVRVAQLFSGIKDRRESFVGLENTVLHENGSLVVVETSGVPLFDKHGNIAGYQGCDRDITERKRSERELLWKTAFLEAQTNASLDGILVVDRRGEVALTNQQFVSIWRIPQNILADKDDRVLLQYVAGCVRQPEKFLERVAYLYNHPCETSRDEIELKSGAVLDRYSSAVLGKDGEHYGRIWTFRDITDLKRSERATRKAKEAAEAATRAKSEFLANMSHEIRTPMTAILGFTDILLDRLRDPENLEAAETIKRNGIYLLDIINDILDLSKIEAERLAIEQMPCSPRAIVDDVLSLMAPRAAEKQLATVSETIGDIPETILADPIRLRQVLINLVGNAIKFTETGTICVRLQLVERPDQSALIQYDVIDSGIGMSQEQIAGLFQPFMQGDASTSRKFGGTGLGLVISKRLAELMGGDITVSSTLGQGSAFRFTADVGSLAALHKAAQRSGAAARLDQERAAEQARPEQFACRLLLAEDGPDNQRLLMFLLRKAGMEVTLARNGRVAVDLALAAERENRPFDLILMDMQMPVMDGYEATRTLRSQGIAVPIIALTAHAMLSDRARCLEAGCDQYITKPVERDRLLDKIWHSLKNRVSTDAQSGLPVDRAT